jgi:hypothetical protein
MDIIETALGRLVPAHKDQTILEDAILSLLYDYYVNPQNPNNVPMKLSNIAGAVAASPALVLAALDALATERQVVEGPQFQQERTFAISGLGVRFVRDMPQGIESLP